MPNVAPSASAPNIEDSDMAMVPYHPLPTTLLFPSFVPSKDFSHTKLPPLLSRGFVNSNLTSGKLGKKKKHQSRPYSPPKTVRPSRSPLNQFLDPTNAAKWWRIKGKGKLQKDLQVEDAVLDLQPLISTQDSYAGSVTASILDLDCHADDSLIANCIFSQQLSKIISQQQLVLSSNSSLISAASEEPPLSNITLPINSSTSLHHDDCLLTDMVDKE